MESRRPQCGLLKVEIDFGSGSGAMRMWNKLDALMPAVKHLLLLEGQPGQWRILRDWQRSVYYRVPELKNSWVMELDGEQWAALSRGLRHLGPRGRSMMAWINNHSMNTYPDGGVVYSPTYRRPKL